MIFNRWLLIIFFCATASLAKAQRPDYLVKDSIRSSLDGAVQVLYYDKAKGGRRPLVVELHSWSFSAESLKNTLAPQARQMNWNYLLPDFRGVNNHPKACCSPYALTDIDEAIDWALKNLPVHTDSIYVVGTSGGGYATLATYMKSRHRIRGFSAWASMTDLAVWYNQGVERKNKFPAEVLLCTGSVDSLDVSKAKSRSPLYWPTPVRQRKGVVLQIYAGIHDGYTGAVPVSHSIAFYNKLLADFKEQQRDRFVSAEDSALLLARNYPADTTNGAIDGKAVLYNRRSGTISLTIFDGGHEMLRNAVISLLLQDPRRKL